MANTRKVQADIDRLLKKTNEGLEAYEELYDKFDSCVNPGTKERLEGDLKKEIKKLQRHREQIKVFMSMSEVKDTKQLEAYRKRIEEKMEAFKACEREVKTKAFSKEGLASASNELYENDMERAEAWLKGVIEECRKRIELLDYDAQRSGGAAVARAGRKNRQPQRSDVHIRLEKLQIHFFKLEALLRMVANEEVSSEEVERIRSPVERVVQDDADLALVSDMSLYDSFDIPDPKSKPVAVALEESGSSPSVMSSAQESAHHSHNNSTNNNNNNNNHNNFIESSSFDVLAHTLLSDDKKAGEPVSAWATKKVSAATTPTAQISATNTVSTNSGSSNHAQTLMMANSAMSAVSARNNTPTPTLASMEHGANAAANTTLSTESSSGQAANSRSGRQRVSSSVAASADNHMANNYNANMYEGEEGNEEEAELRTEAAEPASRKVMRRSSGSSHNPTPSNFQANAPILNDNNASNTAAATTTDANNFSNTNTSSALVGASSVHAIVEDEDDDLDDEEPAEDAPEWMAEEAAAVDALNDDTFGDDGNDGGLMAGTSAAGVGGMLAGMSQALPGSSAKKSAMNLTLADMASYTNRLASEWEQRRAGGGEGAGGMRSDSNNNANANANYAAKHDGLESSGDAGNAMRYMASHSQTGGYAGAGLRAMEEEGLGEDGMMAVGAVQNDNNDNINRHTVNMLGSGNSTTTVNAGGAAATAALGGPVKRVNEWDRRRLDRLKASGKGVEGVSALGMLDVASPAPAMASMFADPVALNSNSSNNNNNITINVLGGLNANKDISSGTVHSNNVVSSVDVPSSADTPNPGDDVRLESASPAVVAITPTIPATSPEAAVPAGSVQPVRSTIPSGISNAASAGPTAAPPAAVSVNKTGIRSPGQKFDMITMHGLLDMSLANLPHTLDIEPQRPYEPPNAIEPIPYFPQEVHPALANRELYRNFDLDTLFFIFYYHQKSYQQYFASKELKAHSFRYHTEQKRWYLRREKPRETSAVDERGSYMYFDFENTWDKQVVDDFLFEYKYLEDDLN